MPVLGASGAVLVGGAAELGHAAARASDPHRGPRSRMERDETGGEIGGEVREPRLFWLLCVSQPPASTVTRRTPMFGADEPRGVLQDVAEGRDWGSSSACPSSTPPTSSSAESASLHAAAERVARCVAKRRSIAPRRSSRNGPSSWKRLIDRKATEGVRSDHGDGFAASEAHACKRSSDPERSHRVHD